MAETTKTKPTPLVNRALALQLRGKAYLRAILALRSHVVITMRHGQWDDLLDAGYQAGALLVEVGDDGRIMRVYQMGSDRQ